MKNDFRRPFWKDQPVTDETIYRNRRQFMKSSLAATGGGILGAAGNAFGQEKSDQDYHIPFHPATLNAYPAEKNEKYVVTDPQRPISDKDDVFTYNNFYEFSTDKNVHLFVRNYEPYPWDLEIGGLCNNPRKLSFDDLVTEFDLEERVYRFRCVEAWSMVVPWTGFPLADLLKTADPTSAAKYVKFTCLHRPDQMRGQKIYHWYQWPYYEGLRLDEAMNPLTLVAVGMYGNNLPKQNGAPLRIVTPWKYGYKGPKAVVKIEFTDKQPSTFWNDSQPKEYGFYSNVNPEKPHPRWSQATEKPLGSEERIPTLLYNGYADLVGDMYDGSEF